MNKQPENKQVNDLVAAFYHEQVEDARRKNGGQQGNE